MKRDDEKNHGGSREGAGRPRSGRKQGAKVYLTPAQIAIISREFKGLGLSTAIRAIVTQWCLRNAKS
jgi:hypothetical protein